MQIDWTTIRRGNADAPPGQAPGSISRRAFLASGAALALAACAQGRFAGDTQPQGSAGTKAAKDANNVKDASAWKPSPPRWSSTCTAMPAA